MEYHIKGYYSFHGKENPFTGMFKIDENKKIIGEIKDSNSVCSRHEVEGHIKSIDDKLIMDFVKIPTGLLANIYYHLEKDDASKLDGEYKGSWSFKTKKVFKLDRDELETETENKTSLTLISK